MKVGNPRLVSWVKMSDVNSVVSYYGNSKLCLNHDFRVNERGWLFHSTKDISMLFLYIFSNIRSYDAIVFKKCCVLFCFFLHEHVSPLGEASQKTRGNSGTEDCPGPSETGNLWKIQDINDVSNERKPVSSRTGWLYNAFYLQYIIY